MLLIATPRRTPKPRPSPQPLRPRPGRLTSLACLGALFCSLLLNSFGYAAEPGLAGNAGNVGTPDAAAVEAPAAQAAPQSGDESPMMLYLVPWNANPESGKKGKKFTLYQPWGSHFDPLTPVQTQQLNAH